MRILDWLPRLAALGALLAWGATILLLPALGVNLSPVSVVIFAVGLGLATLFTLLAQIRQAYAASTLFWLSAGLWAGASFLNANVMGLLYLLVGLVAVASGWVLERAEGRFSLNGPASFVVALLVMYFLSKALAQ